MIVIEDEIHGEQFGEFHALDDAVAELTRLATIRWDQEPNRAPCSSWRTCGREYCLVEFDTSQERWKLLQRVEALMMSAREIRWIDGFRDSWQDLPR